jgi:glucose/arabinose dehydrogenase
MQRLARLALFAVVVVGILLVSGWLFREPLLQAAGISFDRGSPGETALELPGGHQAGIFASGLDHPRFMAVAPDGTLFVAESGENRVLALPDRNGDGRADEVIEVGSDYGVAHSVAFAEDGSLLVAGTSRLFRATLDEELRETEREVLFEYVPSGQHSTRTVAVAPDGSLLVSVGSSCNVCWEKDEERATVISAPAAGGEWRVLMRGLRNAVGVAVDPATGEAWVTNNGRDMMGDDLPPETLYRLVDGGDAGWPRCHAGNIVDPDFGDEPDPVTGLVGCEDVAAPAAQFQAHMAPLGITFWDGQAVIAFHGSWNRSEKVGYEVWALPWDDGPTGPPEVLIGGFLDPVSGDASGRPAGVTVGADGALYVSDDKAGFIYRVTAPA